MLSLTADTEPLLAILSCPVMLGNYNSYAACKFTISAVRGGQDGLAAQDGATTEGSTSPTCQGYSFTSVSTPPTILLALLATPQLHSGDPAVVDGVSVIGVEVDSDVVDGVSVVGCVISVPKLVG